MHRIGKTRKGYRQDAGSALILTVVLTSLLAIVGVLFLMASRIDKMATTATADNRQLGFAVDSVVAQISEVLAKDVPVASSGQEYYDYPDANDAWLADLEPCMLSTDPNHYYWRQISNMTGGNTRHVLIGVVGEREPIDLTVAGTNADADGDGVGDARWFAVPGVTSSKGDPIYAAVRIVDNSAMLNVNAGCRFAPAGPTDPVDKSRVDGHSQVQVNVVALVKGPGYVPIIADEATLLGIRANHDPALAMDLATYGQHEIWQYEWPSGLFAPFDLSDELELRYRYLLNQEDVDTRVEDWGWFKSRTLSTPVDSSGDDLDSWFTRATGAKLLKPGTSVDPNLFPVDPNYAYRHIATTYNLDRVLTPRPVPKGPGTEPYKMVNVNNTDEYELSQAVVTALQGANLRDLGDAAQMIANIRDYIDDDSEVTVFSGTAATSVYFGFERPCVYLSELAYRFVRDPGTNLVHRSFAIELCKPYPEDRDPHQSEYRLLLGGGVTQVITWSGVRQFHVLLSEDSRAPLQSGYVSFKALGTSVDTTLWDEYTAAKYNSPSTQALDSAGFGPGTAIELQRKVVVSGQDRWPTVDRVIVPSASMDPRIAEDGTVHRLQRDVSHERCIFRLWGPAGSAAASLGNADDNYVSTDPRKVQAHPANRPLINIGELGMVFARSAYAMPDPNAATADNLLINLAEPVYQNLFNYLTLMDPTSHNSNLTPMEMRVKGRININTAPPFVLAQLPWMQYYDPLLRRARAITAYRDVNGAFKTIGGLMLPTIRRNDGTLVPALGDLRYDGINNLYDVPAVRGPDLTQDDVTDDLEERDLLFTRISDLVTVRSDVFTAYILVRLGTNGPQKRVVAILDRGMTMSANDAVRVISVEQVPDPR